MSTVPEWMEGLPDDLQESKVLTRIPDVETLAKNLLEKDRMVDSSIRLPGEDDASKQKFAERLDSMGFGPKQTVPDDYELESVGDADWQKEWLSGRKEFYKAAGLTQTQAEKALAEDRKAVDSYAETMEETTKTLQEKHGDKLKSLVENAQKAIDKFGLQKIAESPFGATPEWNELMIEIGKNFSEDGKVGGDGASPAPSKQELEIEQAELNAEMYELMQKGELTEGNPKAKLFEAKMNAFRAKKHGNKDFMAENHEVIDKRGAA